MAAQERRGTVRGWLAGAIAGGVLLSVAGVIVTHDSQVGLMRECRRLEGLACGSPRLMELRI